MTTRSSVRSDAWYSILFLGIQSLLVGCLFAQVSELPQAKTVAIIPFEGDINFFSEAMFYRKLDEAVASGADVIVIEIDSPGGLLGSSQKLAETLQTCDATTIAFVPSAALSGAAMMSLGCDLIVLGPLARLGDVGVIEPGSDSLFRYAPEKIVSDTAEFMRNLAIAGGRSPAIAEAMVDKDVVVYRVTHRTTGELRYLSDAEWAEIPNRQEWEKGPPIRESREGRFLEVNGKRAKELGLADALADSRSDLLNQLKADPAEVKVFQPTWVDSSVMILNSWPITALLVILGLIALYIELMAPGIGVGGLLFLLCCALFFWSRFLGGTSGWLEVILFLAGVLFISVEVFVIPGFGVAGFAGGCLLVTSIVMASQRFSPDDGISLNELLRTLLLLGGSGCVALVVMGILSHYLGSVPILGRMVLTASAPSKAQTQPTARVSQPDSRTNTSARQVGDRGIADSNLRPAGRVKFPNGYADVVTEGSFVAQGSPVEVVRVSGNFIMVQEVVEQA